MGRLSCACLNVSVHYKGSTWNSRPVLARQLFPDGSRDKLFTERLFEIELDVAGVTVEQKSLELTRSVGDWVVHSCSCCEKDVYLLHSVKEEGRVFVTERLMSDAVELAALLRHTNYSPVFKIIINPSLPSLGEEDDGLRRRVQSVSFGREDPVMRKVHSQMKSFLNQEELGMEERIRRYEEEQRAAFSVLQKRAHRDRGLLFTAIAKARENVILDAMGDATAHQSPAHATPPSHTSPRTSPKKSSPEQQHRQQSVSMDTTNITFMLHDSLPPSKVVGGVPLPQGDELFMMEGFDEEGVDEPDCRYHSNPFPQSDDETSTDDSSYRDESAMVVLGVPSSLPVTVPMFQPTPSSHDPSDLGPQSVPQHFDPEQVCSSIKALALSVQDTGMFGDLPRPRINSMPYAR